jgi:hypothetical protein
MVETANFAGLSHAGAPVMMRRSTARPNMQNTRSAAMMNPSAVSAGDAAYPAVTALLHSEERLSEERLSM